MITLKRNLGFTLIELLIAMAISAVVMTAVFSSYQSQQKSYVVQEEVADMQQRLRAAMFYMSNQIREAGCNPTQTDINRPGIVTADADKIRFTADITGVGGNPNPDGKTDGSYEDVTYSLYTSGGIRKLGVKSSVNSTGPQPVIENVDALNFVYLNNSSPPVPTTVLASIRSVEVAIVVHASRKDPDYTDNKQYKNKQGDVIFEPQDDDRHFRRRILNLRIACRNLGL